MLNDYIQSISNLNPKIVKYVEDLNTHIKFSLDQELPFYAVHGHCTDGGTAGAMIRYAVPEAAIVPLDYWLLNNNLARPVLEDLNTL